MGDYVGQLRTLLDEKRHHARELSTLLEQNAFGLATDPTRPVSAPAPEPQPGAQQVDFGPLDSAVSELKRSAAAYDAAYAKLTTGELTLDSAHRNELNALLQSMEHRLTDPRGLPGRDWFKHMVYAPGRLTGYAVKTLPGVREAIEGERWDEANAYVSITAQALTAYARGVEQATALLAGGPAAHPREAAPSPP
jgi:N-acetylated-alpha-linked acidic dipeptidase